MKRLIALLFAVCLAATAEAADVLCYVGASGLDLYLRVDESGTLDAAALTEGTGGRLGRYYVAEADLVTAGVNTASTGDGFACTVHVGATPSTTAEDPIIGTKTLAWDGDEEISDAELIASQVTSGNPPADIATEPVNSNRVFVLVPGTNGLRSESTKTITAGTPPNTYAVDFRNDAASNQKIYSVDDVEIVDGDADGLEFGTIYRDGGTQARFRITGVTAGNYTVRVSGTYVGGAGYRGDILITVVE